MESLAAYIPSDRRLALATSQPLPYLSDGSALFADISGFTPLTEALVRELGPQRGPEELTHHLNQVYDALIAEVHHQGGSVLGFSGDAITCWFDGDRGEHAVACGLAMQRAMARFAAIRVPTGEAFALAMKAAIASGPVRRFVVGDPDIQLHDVLAGATLEALAATEHQANRGEVLIDESTAARLGEAAELGEWRDDGFGRRCALVRGLRRAANAPPTPPFAQPLGPEQLRPWLLPQVFARLQGGQGEFLAELRPVAALFLRFEGIDYEQEAQAQLDGFVRQVQRVIARYDGALIQLTIGDKGSYLYAAFGAPIAHEDDAARAVAAALDLRQLAGPGAAVRSVQIGIAMGRMRTGAYGAATRRTYGVLGDDTNLAARLMMAAAPGQIIASQRIHEATRDLYHWDALPAIQVKGKSQPVTIFGLASGTQHGLRLREPRYALPMVGRSAELALIAARADLALGGQGQIVTIVGEAGMGKSRLLADAIRLVGARGLAGFAGECMSFGTNTSYLVWQPIWRALFGLDTPDEEAPAAERIATALAEVDPALLPRLPLLGAVLNIELPDNELTRSLDPKQRKTALESLLVGYLRGRARRKPMLLVLEDCHWLDPLSHDLIEIVGRATADIPVLMLIAHRPFELARLQAPRVSTLPHFSELRISELAPEEVEHLIALKLAQLYDGADAPTADVVARIAARSQGNPFYIEELVNYIHDLGLDPADAHALSQVDLPSSLHSLILSRIDTLSERERTTLRVASVIGRLFTGALLWGAYPQLGGEQPVRADLEQLSQLDLTPLESPEPELTYLFKHIVTQEVAYESLPFATRAWLHDQIAGYIEQVDAEHLDQKLDLLAFHYDRSGNAPKRREYLLRAGEAAQADYANDAAIDYYQRVLPLLDESQRAQTLLKLGTVLELVGRWAEAADHYRQALVLSVQLDDRAGHAQAQLANGLLLWRQGEYAEATPWAERAQLAFEAADDQAGRARALNLSGLLADCQGNYDEARRLYEAGIAIWRTIDNKLRLAETISNMGVMACSMGEYAQARDTHEEALALRRETGNRWGIAVSLNNLGTALLYLGQYRAARARIEEALLLMREIGDRWMIANFLSNLANVARNQGELAQAAELYQQSLRATWELGDKWALAYLLEDIAGLLAIQARYADSLRLVAVAGATREAIGAPLSPAEQEQLAALLRAATDALSPEQQAACQRAGLGLPLEHAVADTLRLLDASAPRPA
jgi:adenylate cyclase